MSQNILSLLGVSGANPSVDRSKRREKYDGFDDDSSDDDNHHPLPKKRCRDMPYPPSTDGDKGAINNLDGFFVSCPEDIPPVCQLYDPYQSIDECIESYKYYLREERLAIRPHGTPPSHYHSRLFRHHYPSVVASSIADHTNYADEYDIIAPPPPHPPPQPQSQSPHHPQHEIPPFMFPDDPPIIPLHLQPGVTPLFSFSPPSHDGFPSAPTPTSPLSNTTHTPFHHGHHSHRDNSQNNHIPTASPVSRIVYTPKANTILNKTVAELFETTFQHDTEFLNAAHALLRLYNTLVTTHTHTRHVPPPHDDNSDHTNTTHSHNDHPHHTPPHDIAIYRNHPMALSNFVSTEHRFRYFFQLLFSVIGALPLLLSRLPWLRSITRAITLHFAKANITSSSHLETYPFSSLPPLLPPFLATPYPNYFSLRFSSLTGADGRVTGGFGLNVGSGVIPLRIPRFVTLDEDGTPVITQLDSDDDIADHILSSGTLPARSPMHSSMRTSVVFSPNGKYFAVSQPDYNSRRACVVDIYLFADIYAQSTLSPSPILASLTTGPAVTITLHPGATRSQVHGTLLAFLDNRFLAIRQLYAASPILIYDIDALVASFSLTTVNYGVIGVCPGGRDTRPGGDGYDIRNLTTTPRVPLGSHPLPLSLPPSDLDILGSIPISVDPLTAHPVRCCKDSTSDGNEEANAEDDLFAPSHSLHVVDHPQTPRPCAILRLPPAPGASPAPNSNADHTSMWVIHHGPPSPPPPHHMHDLHSHPPSDLPHRYGHGHEHGHGRGNALYTDPPPNRDHFVTLVLSLSDTLFFYSINLSMLHDPHNTRRAVNTAHQQPSSFHLQTSPHSTLFSLVASRYLPQQPTRRPSPGTRLGATNIASPSTSTLSPPPSTQPSAPVQGPQPRTITLVDCIGVYHQECFLNTPQVFSPGSASHRSPIASHGGDPHCVSFFVYSNGTIILFPHQPPHTTPSSSHRHGHHKPGLSFAHQCSTTLSTARVYPFSLAFPLFQFHPNPKEREIQFKHHDIDALPSVDQLPPLDSLLSCTFVQIPPGLELHPLLQHPAATQPSAPPVSPPAPPSHLTHDNYFHHCTTGFPYLSRLMMVIQTKTNDIYLYFPDHHILIMVSPSLLVLPQSKTTNHMQSMDNHRYEPMLSPQIPSIRAPYSLSDTYESFYPRFTTSYSTAHETGLFSASSRSSSSSSSSPTPPPPPPPSPPPPSQSEKQNAVQAINTYTKKSPYGSCTICATISSPRAQPSMSLPPFSKEHTANNITNHKHHRHPHYPDGDGNNNTLTLSIMVVFGGAVYRSTVDISHIFAPWQHSLSMNLAITQGNAASPSHSTSLSTSSMVSGMYFPLGNLSTPLPTTMPGNFPGEVPPLMMTNIIFPRHGDGGHGGGDGNDDAHGEDSDGNHTALSVSSHANDDNNITQMASHPTQCDEDSIHCMQNNEKDDDADDIDSFLDDIFNDSSLSTNTNTANHPISTTKCHMHPAQTTHIPPTGGGITGDVRNGDRQGQGKRQTSAESYSLFEAESMGNIVDMHDDSASGSNMPTMHHTYQAYFQAPPPITFITTPLPPPLPHTVEESPREPAPSTQQSTLPSASQPPHVHPQPVIYHSPHSIEDDSRHPPRHTMGLYSGVATTPWVPLTIAIDAKTLNISPDPSLARDINTHIALGYHLASRMSGKRANYILQQPADTSGASPPHNADTPSQPLRQQSQAPSSGFSTPSSLHEDMLSIPPTSDRPRQRQSLLPRSTQVIRDRHRVWVMREIHTNAFLRRLSSPPMMNTTNTTNTRDGDGPFMWTNTTMTTNATPFAPAPTVPNININLNTNTNININTTPNNNTNNSRAESNNAKISKSQLFDVSQNHQGITSIATLQGLRSNHRDNTPYENDYGDGDDAIPRTADRIYEDTQRLFHALASTGDGDEEVADHLDNDGISYGIPQRITGMAKHPLYDIYILTFVDGSIIMIRN